MIAELIKIHNLSYADIYERLEKYVKKEYFLKQLDRKISTEDQLECLVLIDCLQTYLGGSREKVIEHLNEIVNKIEVAE